MTDLLPIIRQMHDADGDRARARLLLSCPDVILLKFAGSLDEAWAGWFAGMRAELPDARESDPYPAMLDAAGFDVLVDDVLTVTLDAPLDRRARQFAQRHVDRMRTALEGHADLAALAAIAADDGIARRDDVALHATRHLFIAVA